MNKFYFLFLFLCLLVMQSLAAQRYLNLSVDNDLYFGKDRYYSSGVFISLGKLKEGIGGNEATKKYVHWTLGQEIYTPTKRYTTDVDLFDYPYGGWLFLERTEEVQKNGNASWLWSIKAGMTGEASLAPLFQNFYHDKILDLPHMAWEQAVPQRFHVNVNGGFKRRIHLFNKGAFLTNLYGNLGTQRSAVGVNFGLLLGSSKVISYAGNPLEMQEDGFGFYIGTRQEYRFHDFMISGSLFDDTAPFVLPAIPYKNSLEIGLAFYGKKWRFQTLWNRVSKDNKAQIPNGHYYLNISIARFF